MKMKGLFIEDEVKIIYKDLLMYQVLEDQEVGN